MNTLGKVLVLGAGLVAGPLVRYLAQCGHRVTVADIILSKAEKIVEGLDQAVAVSADITDTKTLDKLVPDFDVVVSLVPHTHHIIVAKVCLKHKKHMVTASYIKPEIKAMEEEIKAAGLTFLNEIGLDPGLDHMSAMKIIDRVKADGGKLVGFSSNCGGLPAPESNDNPLGYKFSWSPRGVVLAATNSARFLKDGQEVNLDGRDLFTKTWPLTLAGLGDFEVYTNRDCLGYIDLYGLQGVKDMFRGTIRYVGWSDLMLSLGRVGYLSLDERNDLAGRTYADLTASLVDGAGEGLAETLASFLRIDSDSPVIDKIKWLGLLSGDQIPEGVTTTLDALVERMLSGMDYKPGERDMIILQHRFNVEYADRKETIVSTLIDYGIPEGDSSMSRTVALPAAIGVDRILQGEITLTGVLAPTDKKIYKPVLAKLEELGIQFKETIQ